MVPVKIDATRATREQAIEALTGVWKNAAETMPPEIALMDIDALESVRKPTEIDFFLRRNLWKQVDMVQNGLIPDIAPADIYRGVCSKQNYDRIATTPHRLAWILLPPTEDSERLAAGLSIGITNLVKFVSREPTAETASAFMKAIEFLYTRVHGPVVQRIDARHAHAHVNMKDAPAAPEDVKNRIEELKAKLVGGQ